MDLLPGLPDDVARRCLARLKRSCHWSASAVSKSWRQALRSDELFEARKVAGLEEPWLYVHVAQPTSTIWKVYDPDRDTWRRMRNLPANVAYYGTAVINRMLYVMGGRSDAIAPLTGEPEEHEAHDEVWGLDVAAGNWTKCPSMPQRRSCFACVVLGSKVMVAGGHARLAEPLASSYMIDPATGCWEELPPMPVAWNFCYGFHLDDKVYIHQRSVVGVQVYNISTRSWRHEPDLALCGQCVVIDGTAFVFAANRCVKAFTSVDGICVYPSTIPPVKYGGGVAALGSSRVALVGGYALPFQDHLSNDATSETYTWDLKSKKSDRGADLARLEGTVSACAVVAL